MNTQLTVSTKSIKGLSLEHEIMLIQKGYEKVIDNKNTSIWRLTLTKCSECGRYEWFENDWRKEAPAKIINPCLIKKEVGNISTGICPECHNKLMVKIDGKNR
jgi:hypothetical protein